MNASDTNPGPDSDSAVKMLEAAIGQIKFARQYCLELLDHTPDELWFEMPDGLPTHIAWQVGHLTVSQYGLLMFRIRGRSPDDLALIPSRFRKAYSRSSTPSVETVKQPSAIELRERLGIVYERSLSELVKTAPETLLEPVDMPYAAYPNKLGAILFCPIHEHTHIGQIGLLRRALGLEPVR
ncbi:MAG: DinB family protein [Rubripirellula sp.]|jgi:hypothetical protein|nr:DinB family protein [Rubripirellula sp.]